MKIGLIYSTMTGHSKKIADAIAKDLDITALNIKDNPKIENLDLLFIVGGIYGGKSSEDLINYCKNLDSNNVKKVALITSCCSKDTSKNVLKQILEEKQIEIVKDEFVCQGGFLFVGITHPNKKDFEDAVSFSKKILSENT